MLREDGIESGFLSKLQDLKYQYRADITDRASLEKNFRDKFEAFNRVHLTDSEFARLMEEIITPDVFTAARTLRAMNAFIRDDGTPLNYTLVNIRDWCKNTFDVINQLRINSDISHHRVSISRANEFNMVQKRCVEENTNTATLVHRLLSDEYADKVRAGRAIAFHRNL